MSSLTIKNLNKIYNPGKNEVHAVKDFNLEIEDGEFVALLGPSGCGKTSTQNDCRTREYYFWQYLIR